MKRILGLDLGTNSIGWALVEQSFEEKQGRILGLGSRIIPMSQDIMDKFGQGQSHSQTAERTNYRGVRRLRQRHLLRRERLHRVLNILGALPEHYSKEIDFIDRKGQFLKDVEVKLNYTKDISGKHEFLFKESFNEMVNEFNETDINLKIPYDWTIYYLRKKAISEKISFEELSWLLIHFNQKRGYYQLRGDEDETDKNKLVEFHALKVVEVTAEEPNHKNEIWYNIKLENEWIYRRKSNRPLFGWKGKKIELIVTTPLDSSGQIKKDKDGEINRSFRAPKEDDWGRLKLKTENDIENFNNQHHKKGVGTYIYQSLLQNPNQKINGKLVRTIERHFYKEELEAILEKQKEFHPKLNDPKILESCIQELYANNYARQNILKQKDFTYLFVNDIIFYQRPLRSKKSLVDGCKYERRPMKDKNGELAKDENGNQITKALKVIHKSHPLYQEFRLWQFVDNLKIYKREKVKDGKLHSDVDVTNEFISDEETVVKLFEILNNKAKIKQSQMLALKEVFGKKLSEKEYRWNYVEDKEYPLNETRALFISKLSKDKDFDYLSYLTQENEIKLWHLLYSISDKKEFERALENKKSKLGLPLEIRREFKKVKPFANEYGALSEKAIKKLLPLMRKGKYWSFDNINDEVKSRIQKIITGEFDEKIKDRVREKANYLNLSDENNFKGLPLWVASYVVYDRHSESSDIYKWKKAEEIRSFLEEFKQHSLRNPIVEQVITETLRVVKDIWDYYGSGVEDYFDEIHVELGREMKNPADKRKIMTANINKNQDTNERVRNLLREFKASGINGVIPHSPSQQEKLKIFEEGILSQYSEKELENEVVEGVNIAKVAKSAEPTLKEIQKYKLWMEQKYRSPYTGRVIPLSQLFTTDYEIEHVIPQARYFDDSIGNKVICETEVNKAKGNQTAFEFISKNPGRIIDLGKGNSVKVFNIGAYQDFVSQNFTKGSKKFKILLSEDVPEQFISRQLNDTRYISKVVKSLLSNIVREKDEQESTSKNVVSVTGGVTTILKKDWALNDKWNEIIRPRFERMNKITNSSDYGYFDEKANFFRLSVPNDLKKNFNKKRIDHRHHAMDALVVALVTKNHVSYLSNEHAKSDNKRYDLRNKLRRVEKVDINGKDITVSKEFLLPWKSFPVDAQKALEGIIVSFKQNLRVQTKATNKYWSYYDEYGKIRKDKAGNPQKKLTKQIKGNTRAVRKAMHDPMPYGKIELWFDVLEIFDSQNKIKFIIDEKVKSKAKNLMKIGFSKLKKDFKKNTKEYNKLFAKLEKLRKENKMVDTDEQKMNKILIEQESILLKMELIKPNIIINEIGYAIDKTYFKLKNKKYGKRQPLEKLLAGKDYAGILKSINKIGDYNLQLNLTEHLNKYFSKNNVDLAFAPEGINEFNINRKNPVYNVRSVESGTKRFKLGNKEKYVEATDGNNLYFAIYWNDDEQRREFETIPLMEVIEHQKWRAGLGKEEIANTSLFPITKTKGKFLFYLSPNDSVYVPTLEELENIDHIDFSALSVEQKKRVFIVNDFSGVTVYFKPNSFAKNIAPKELDTSFDSKLSKFDDLVIKDNCIKLKVDRIGNISKF